MKIKNINSIPSKKRVLIAPLDWGLGHATRCIPIIYELINLDVEVIIAAEGKIKILLEKEFPKLEIVYLRGYHVKYSRQKWLFPIKLLFQFPKIISSIYHEHLWLKKVIKLYNIDAVISDNRLGLCHTTIPCVYITHQLTIKTTNRFTEWLAKKIHYFFINKFLFCWVPDNESSNNLAGALSHPYQLPLIPIIYIGPLSRFVKFSVEKKYDCIALVSGPEPQRTIFENILLRELNLFEGKSLLIRGLPEKDEKVTIVNKRVEIINHLTATALNKAMLQADLIVCRSGYTSVIDLVQLQKKAVLVATPGQTEQEYLAAYLQQQHFFPSISQNRFTLNKAFDMINDFTFVNIDINTEVYKTVLHKFVSFIKQDQ